MRWPYHIQYDIQAEQSASKVMTANDRFGWTRFYEAIADGILQFRDDRKVLVDEIHAIYKRVNWKIMEDQFRDGTRGPLRDICPFTAMGIFNRGSDAKRKEVADLLATFLKIPVRLSDDFNTPGGIPVLHPQSSWLFTYEKERKDDDIDGCTLGTLCRSASVCWQ